METSLLTPETPTAARITLDLPGAWDDIRDITFFRLTATLFPPAFTFGASVLLASYDL
jgi:hypothetical protein